MAPMAHGQEPAAIPEPASPSISATQSAGADERIRERLERIYAQLEPLGGVEVSVAEGVVTIKGVVPDRNAATEARAIAERVEGVVAVKDETESSVEVRERLSPFFARSSDMWANTVEAAPLILVSALVFLAVTGMAWWAGSWSAVWRRVTPNVFLADLVGQAVRIAGVVVALVVALNLAGATTLMGAILGGAGVVGLAVGFAVRDSLENYISSIMLSLRQPFRANDHVIIDEQEGKVVRLTSRATILMTLDGNHLRIPNAIVFKAVILNYTKNPERRLAFRLGVDANDDPQAAIEVGLAALAPLDFILTDPGPVGGIETVGDSNIVLVFYAWIDQTRADFLKARSQAIRAAKLAIEAAGFTLPEPIYRLRIDEFPAGARVRIANPEPALAQKTSAERSQAPMPDEVSVHPEAHLDEKIETERRISRNTDLLDPQRPVE